MIASKKDDPPLGKVSKDMHMMEHCLDEIKTNFAISLFLLLGKNFLSFGPMKLPAQVKYDGFYFKKKYHCFGHLELPKKGTSYIGHFDNGLKHGVGRLVTPEFIYDGTFNNGQMTGTGLLIKLGDSPSIYKGGVFRGEMEGWGTLRANSLIYSGRLYRDRFCGEGILLDSSINMFYVGEFLWGNKSGYGIYSCDTHQYKGEFLQDKMHGKGLLIWHNGDKYEGHFEDDTFHGKGTLTLADGQITTGIWSQGKLL